MSTTSESGPDSAGRKKTLPLVQLTSHNPRVTARLPGLLTGLRYEQQHAPSSAYEVPGPDALDPQWIEGRRWLEAYTQTVRNPVSEACRAAPAAQQAPDGSLYIPPRQPLPLEPEISVRLVDGFYLWIGVQLGTALVLDPDEHGLLQELARGTTPSELVERSLAARGQPRTEAWRAIALLVSRLIDVGFIRGIQDHLEVRDVDPRRFLRIHLTQQCNLACAHCYADSSPYADTSGQLSVERWTSLLTEFARHGGERVLFTGGEALLYPGCEALLLHAKALGLHVTLFSNGLRVERHLDAIRASCDVVQISVDGVDPTSNDPIRGAGSFAHALRAIDLLVEVGIPVRVSTVVMDRNFPAIRDGFEQFAARWADRVDFRLGNGLTTHGRGQEIENTLSHEEAREVIDGLEARWGQFGPPRTFRRTRSCGYCEQLVVAQDGSVHPCHLLDGAVAHVDDGPYEELLAKLHRTGDDYSVDRTLGCNRCDIRYLCGGECRVENGKLTGNRRVTSCQAEDKLRRLRNLVKTYRRQSPTLNTEAIHG